MKPLTSVPDIRPRKVIDLDGPWLIDTRTLSPVRPATPEEVAADPEAPPFPVTVTHRVFVDHLDPVDFDQFADTDDLDDPFDEFGEFGDPDDDGPEVGEVVRWYLATHLPSLVVWVAVTAVAFTLYRPELQNAGLVIGDCVAWFFRLGPWTAAAGVGAYFLAVTAIYEALAYFEWKANR